MTLFSKVPEHLAVITDGNGRWATKNNIPRIAGHKKGADKVRILVENCLKYNINSLTLFVFSSENWSRPEKEISGLMKLILEMLKKETPKLNAENIKVRIIGDRSALSLDLIEKIKTVECLTENNTRLNLNLAINYGGRWDICHTVRTIARDVKNSIIDVNKINESMVNSYMSLSDLPNVDLLIRTGNVSRISNFLLWQAAYSELYFSKILWPDFDEKEFIAALSFYQEQERLFGKTREQAAKLKGKEKL